MYNSFTHLAGRVSALEMNTSSADSKYYSQTEKETLALLASYQKQAINERSALKAKIKEEQVSNTVTLELTPAGLAAYIADYQEYVATKTRWIRKDGQDVEETIPGKEREVPLGLVSTKDGRFVIQVSTSSLQTMDRYKAQNERAAGYNAIN